MRGRRCPHGKAVDERTRGHNPDCPEIRPGSLHQDGRAFLSVELCRGYRLPQWRNDASVDRDERTFLSNLAARSPYLDGVVDEILDRAGRSEVRFQGHRAEGLLRNVLSSRSTLASLRHCGSRYPRQSSTLRNALSVLMERPRPNFRAEIGRASC